MTDPVSSSVSVYTRRFSVRKPVLPSPPPDDLSLIIAIPAYKEPNIVKTLRSLASCNPPKGKVEVIVTVNAPEDASEEVLKINRETLEQVRRLQENGLPDFLDVMTIWEDRVPVRYAGAGWARKVGMDEAVQRWAMTGKDGAIICLDADCTVSANYLEEAEQAFADPDVRVAHFYFEHLYQYETDPVLRQGIIDYELHLRCYINGLRWAGYPFAIHTVGSCMAVRASAYARAGGMNRRKAGEDFYFLHKLAPLGGWKDIARATVYPSCRASDRVPFGTGRVQLDRLEKGSPGLTYHADSYLVMQPFFQFLNNAFNPSEIVRYSFAPGVSAFMDETGLDKALEEMRRQATTREAFARRCWQWMDGFRVLRLTHYLRDNGFPPQPVMDVARTLLHRQGIMADLAAAEMLATFRRIDRHKGMLPDKN